MPRRLLMINALLGMLACLFVAGLIREAVSARPVPAPPAPRAVRPATAPAPTSTAPPPAVSGQGGIVAKNLFSPTRSEAPTGPAVAAGPKPVLHGVVMDGDKSRAYLEDPASQRTFGYAIGDSVGGGRVQSISPDQVVIIRPEGRVEVLLRDPSKPRAVGPQPAAGTPGGFPVPVTAGAPPGPPGPRVEGTPAPRRPAPPAPGAADRR